MCCRSWRCGRWWGRRCRWWRFMKRACFFLVGPAGVHHTDQAAGDREGTLFARHHPLVRLCMVLHDVTQTAHSLKSGQHVDDRAHSSTLHRHASPRHRRRHFPLITAYFVILHWVQTTCSMKYGYYGLINTTKNIVLIIIIIKYIHKQGIVINDQVAWCPSSLRSSLLVQTPSE